MKDGVCDDRASGAAEQTKVVSDGPSNPLRAVDQVVCPRAARGTGWAAFELAWRKQARSSSHGVAPDGLSQTQRAEVGAPPVPLPPGQPAQQKVVSVGRLLSRHAWFSAKP